MQSALISNETKQKIYVRLVEESSDTKLAKEFNVSRKTVWRLRQIKPKLIIPPPLEGAVPVQVELKPSITTLDIPEVPHVPPTPPPPLEHVSTKVEIPLTPLPNFSKEAATKYFAVQLYKWESYKAVVQEILSIAKDVNVEFKKIQVLGIFTVGVTSFVRFRSDLQDTSVIVNQFKSRPRAFITQIGKNFVIQFPNGKQGMCPVALMCSTPKEGYGSFRGNQMAHP